MFSYTKLIKNRSAGFTLAEVLITLVIIGIISAAVIPLMMNNLHKDEMAFRLQRSYSLFNQALLMMARDNDSNSELSETGIFNSSDSTFGNELMKYIKVTKNCGTGSGCFPPQMGSEFQTLSTKVASTSITGSHYSFISLDNVAYMVQSTGAGCVSSFNGASSSLYSKHMTQICGLVWIDLNAHKPPNSWGNDIFLFYITNGKGPSLYPAGGRDDSRMRWSNDGVTATNCTKASPNGYACAGRVVEEGWQVNY